MRLATPRRIFKHEQAKADLVAIYAYLAQRSQRAAQCFLDKTRPAFDLIARMPDLGVVTALHGARDLPPLIESLPMSEDPSAVE